VLPLLSCIISLIFALVIIDQYFARRKAYQFVWAVGLIMYFIGTGTEFLAGIQGVTPLVYRLWYLCGAVFGAAYLGMGTVYLIASRKIAHAFMVILLVASVYAIIRVFTSDIDFSNVFYLSGRAMPQGVRAMTPLFNTFGTVALVGGALYSALAYWRRRYMPHRVLSNILIAVGAMMPAIGGIVIRYGGSPTVFYALELVGILVIFSGFLRNREVFGLYRFPLIHGFKKVMVE